MKDLIVLITYFILHISFLAGIVILVLNGKWSWIYIIVGLMILSSIRITIHME